MSANRTFLDEERGVLDRATADEIVELLADQLASTGYAANTIAVYSLASERFIRWLFKRRSASPQINEEAVQNFLNRHLPRCRCRPSCPTLTNSRAGLHHLRRLFETMYPDRFREPPPARDGVDVEIEEFKDYLEHVCGVAAASRTIRAML